jgi:hypothetical protein
MNVGSASRQESDRCRVRCEASDLLRPCVIELGVQLEGVVT